MKQAFKRVRVPLIATFAIFLIVLTAFAAVKPEVLTLSFSPAETSITGNAIVDRTFYDAHFTVAMPCTTLNDPVCGTDAKTYLNLCHAIKAGVDARHQGNCQGCCCCNPC
jgi:hypothetical protein